jgi:hypothetical protein
MKDLNTPESVGKELLKGYKAGLKTDEDACLTIHNDLQRIDKELQAINRELNALNKNLRRR